MKAKILSVSFILLMICIVSVVGKHPPDKAQPETDIISGINENPYNNKSIEQVCRRHGYERGGILEGGIAKNDDIVWNVSCIIDEGEVLTLPQSKGIEESNPCGKIGQTEHNHYGGNEKGESFTFFCVKTKAMSWTVTSPNVYVEITCANAKQKTASLDTNVIKNCWKKFQGPFDSKSILKLENGYFVNEIIAEKAKTMATDIREAAKRRYADKCRATSRSSDRPECCTITVSPYEERENIKEEIQKKPAHQMKNSKQR